MLGALRLYEMQADSLYFSGARGNPRAIRRRWPPSACSRSAIRSCWTAAARALAEALSVGVEALEPALASWGTGERATLEWRPTTSDREALGAPATCWDSDRRSRRKCRPHRRLQSRLSVVSDRSGSVYDATLLHRATGRHRVIAESVGREARRQLVGEVVRAWVDDIPDQELSVHYAKAIADLDEDDLHLLAAWHASLEVGQPIPNTEFLVGVFPSLGENRREALKIAAGFRGEEAFQAGVSEEQALCTVLPRLSRERAIELAGECIQLYMWDRLGCDN